MRHRAIVTTGLISTLLIATSPNTSSAQSADKNREMAQALLTDASNLMDVGNYAAACPKLENAVSLVPEAIGANLVLGECYLGKGAFVQAWQQYNQAERLAFARHDDRVHDAQMAMNEIDKHVARLVLVVSNEIRVIPGLRILLDKAELPPNLWGSTIRVTPGKHLIEAAAPQRYSYRKSLLLTSASRTNTEAIPYLSTIVSDDKKDADSLVDRLPTKSGSKERFPYAPYILIPTGMVGLVGGLATIASTGSDAGLYVGVGVATIGTLSAAGGIYLLDMNAKSTRRPSVSGNRLHLTVNPTGFTLRGTF